MSPRLGDLFLTAQSDERLVSLAQAGHERAFAVIVERYRSELLVLARRLSSDGKGEDIVQQAFLSSFTALRSGAEVRHLRGWLYQIVRNTANRSNAPVCVPLDGATAGGETVEDIVQQRATAIGALTEMARLPSRQRQAIVGTALDGRPRAEIASAMGLSEGAVRQLVHRARAQPPDRRHRGHSVAAGQVVRRRAPRLRERPRDGGGRRRGRGIIGWRGAEARGSAGFGHDRHRGGGQ